MSKRHFSWLLALTVVVAVVIALLPQHAGKEASLQVHALLPDLADRVNDIAELRIVAAGPKPVATLHRTEQAWVVEEAHGYAADWSRVRGLLAALARARVVEPKTANPEYFDRLGLRDVDDEKSRAVEVRLGPGDDAPAVLIGDAASNREGQYVRLVGGDRALLIDRTLDVPAETRDWLDRDIVDIPETEVVEVDIDHPDGDRVVLNKTSADDADFVMQNKPEGREVQSSWTVNAPGGGLAGLRLDDVRPAQEVAFESPVQLRVLTADGLQIDAQLEARDDLHWIRLQASAHSAPEREPPTGDEADSAAPDADAGTGTTEADAEADTRPGTAAAADTAEQGGDAGGGPGQPDAATRAAEINARVTGWAYAIPQYKYDVLTRHTADLLKAEENAGEKAD